MAEREPQRARVPLIVGNWKMFKTSAEGAAFVRDLAQGARTASTTGRWWSLRPSPACTRR